jgi:hypothetical protein
MRTAMTGPRTSRGFQKAPRLHAGDRLAAVTLSWGGPGEIPHRYEVGKRQLERAFDVSLVEMPHTLASPDFLAEHPQARLTTSTLRSLTRRSPESSRRSGETIRSAFSR